MNHKQVARLPELVEGDVFYLNGNAKKTKLVLIHLHSTKLRYSNNHVFTARVREQAIHVTLEKPNEWSKHDKTITNAENVEVVFLRHKEAIA